MNEELYDPECLSCERAQQDYAALDNELAECKALLRDILPDMMARVEGLVLRAKRRNEDHVRRIKELLR
jgi:hypothetical protein